MSARDSLPQEENIISPADSIAASNGHKPVTIEFTGKNSVVARAGKKVVGAAHGWMDFQDRVGSEPSLKLLEG